MRAIGVLAGGLIMGAMLSCGGGLPTATSPSPSPQPAAPAPLAAQLSRTSFAGLIVDDAEAHVGGVAVTLRGVDGNVQVVSDASGAFSAEITPWVGGLDAEARKEGFETGFYWLSSRQALTSRIRLHRIVEIRPGDAARVSVGPGDASCGFDYEYLCRRIRVRSAAAGTLNVTATSVQFGDQVGVASSTDAVPKAVPRYSARVTAGTNVSLDVLLWWTSSAQDISVTTELVPD